MGYYKSLLTVVFKAFFMTDISVPSSRACTPAGRANIKTSDKVHIIYSCYHRSFRYLCKRPQSASYPLQVVRSRPIWSVPTVVLIDKMVKIVQENHSIGYWRGKQGNDNGRSLANFALKLRKHVTAPAELPQYSGFVVEVSQRKGSSARSLGQDSSVITG